MIKILVVDDHAMFRQAVVGQIRLQEGLDVVAETGSGVDAVRLAQALGPDMVIMDISLPDIDGIEAAKDIKKTLPRCRIVLLSMHRYPDLMDMLREMGIDGYVLKDDAFDDLLYAIKAAADGKGYMSHSLLAGEMVSPKLPSRTSPLTEREREITCLIAEGLSSRRIAERLCISIKTVETHRARIMKKLGIENIAQLVRYAVRAGLVRP